MFYRAIKLFFFITGTNYRYAENQSVCLIKKSWHNITCTIYVYDIAPANQHFTRYHVLHTWSNHTLFKAFNYLNMHPNT